MKKILFILAIFLATVSSVKAFDWFSDKGIFKNLTPQEFQQIQEQAVGFESQSGVEINGGSGVFGSSLTPVTNNTYDLGSSSKQWNDIFSAGTATLQDVTINGTCTGCGTSGANTALSNLAAVSINLSLLPSSDIAIDLGSQSLRYRTGYMAGLNVSSTLEIGNSFRINATATNASGTFYIDSSGNVDTSGTIRQGRATFSASITLVSASTTPLGLLIPFTTSTLTRDPSFMSITCSNTLDVSPIFGSIHNSIYNQQSFNPAKNNLKDNSVIFANGGNGILNGRANYWSSTSTNIVITTTGVPGGGTLGDYELGTLYCMGYAE